MNDNSKKNGVKENKISLSPDKQIYRSAAVDVSPVDAIEELVDNALDNWMRTSQRVDDISISIEAEDGFTRVVDDTGGLSRDRIQHLFALGKTLQDEVDGAIAAYGIGAKKAIVRLGDDRTVKSRDRDADQGYGFSVDEDWLNSDDWSVTVETFDDLDPGETELVMETEERVWDDDTLSQLRTQLGETYKLFLNGSMPDAGRVELTLNGTSIEPASDPDWSYTPFDGLHPRRYENIELRPKSVGAPVSMDVTVGLMREGNEKQSGTAIYCQNRLVTDNEHGEVGGYGDTGRNRIGNWSHHNNRLKVIVELTTMGDGSDLPWDAQKSTIDPHHAVSRAMYSWLNRIVTPYFNADAAAIRKAFVYPYDAESEYAANGGEIEVLDQAGIDNVKAKPNDNFDDVTYVMRTAEAYAEKGFKYYGDIDELFIPAFDAHFANNYDPEENDGIALEHVEVRTEIDDEDRFDLETQERELANLIADVRGAGGSKKDALMKAGFLSLEDIADASISDLVSVSGVGRKLAKRLREEARSRTEASTPEEAEDDSTAEQTDTDESADDAASDQATEGDDDGDVEPFDTDGRSGESIPPTDSPFVDGPASVMKDQDDDTVEVSLGFSREEYERIQQKLDIEEDDPAAVAEELRDLIQRMYGLDRLQAQQ